MSGGTGRRDHRERDEPDRERAGPRRPAPGDVLPASLRLANAAVRAGRAVPGERGRGVLQVGERSAGERHRHRATAASGKAG